MYRENFWSRLCMGTTDFGYFGGCGGETYPWEATTVVQSFVAVAGTAIQSFEEDGGRCKTRPRIASAQTEEGFAATRVRFWVWLQTTCDTATCLEGAGWKLLIMMEYIRMETVFAQELD